MGIIVGDEIKTITYVQKSKQEKVESQLLRRIIAEIIYGKPESSYWHWRDITEGLASKDRLMELQKSVLSFRDSFK